MSYDFSSDPEEIGDGIMVAFRWNESRAENVFTIFGDEVAISYCDDKGLPRVDFMERLHLGIDSFRRTLIVCALAWSRAEQLALMWRQMPHLYPDLWHIDDVRVNQVREDAAPDANRIP